jgi:hypothetical protein
MSRQFEVEDFPVREPNHEEDMKRPEQNPSDADKIATPVRCPMHGALASRGMGPDWACADTRLRFSRKPRTLSLLSRTISNGLRQPPTCHNPKAPFGVAQARIRQGQLCHHSSLVCKHDTPALNLLDVETHQRFAMWAVYGKRADGSEPKAWIVAAKCCFLKCN